VIIKNNCKGMKRNEVGDNIMLEKAVHCKKSLSISPSPAGMSLTKLTLTGNYLIIPGQGDFGK
jgi:hypothetical protein